MIIAKAFAGSLILTGLMTTATEATGTEVSTPTIVVTLTLLMGILDRVLRMIKDLKDMGQAWSTEAHHMASKGDPRQKAVAKYLMDRVATRMISKGRQKEKADLVKKMLAKAQQDNGEAGPELQEQLRTSKTAKGIKWAARWLPVVGRFL